MVWYKETISHKKKLLASLIKTPLAELTQSCSRHWSDAGKLHDVLQDGLCKLPHCQLLYLIDTQGKQISPNLARGVRDNSWYGQDLSSRPYLKANLPYRGMVLSAVYLCQRSMQPCITAVQAVRKDEQLLGFLVADFLVNKLPNTSGAGLPRMAWQKTPVQGNGKNALLLPRRETSNTDTNIDYLIYVLSTLLQEHGVFQFQLHFSSNRCLLWTMDDPYRYQILSTDELMDSELFLSFPKQSYPGQATVDTEKIPLVLAQLKALREADDTIYLRAGSLNTINGMVMISFSCEGSHCLQVEKFLDGDFNMWINQRVLYNEPDKDKEAVLQN